MDYFPVNQLAGVVSTLLRSDILSTRIDKPFYTWRIETQGALYEAKINGVLLEKDFQGDQLVSEEPVNHYMRSGKNRIGFQLYTRTPEDFGNAKISLSLYVNEDEALESEKTLVGQVTFNAADFSSKTPEKSIQSSVTAAKLDSANNYQVSEQGDVIIHSAVIEPSKVRPHAFHIYQDIEVSVPFPEWGFFSAEPVEFPDAIADYLDNFELYEQELLNPLCSVYKQVFDVMKIENMDNILPLFVERNHELDLAFYYSPGTSEQKLKNSLLEDFDDEDTVFKLKDFKFAKPTVSDDKRLIMLGGDSMIYFEDEEDEIFDHYTMWFYQKNGKWIICR